jgi:hypothetical protein
MKLLNKLSKEWALSNSSPEGEGADQLYEILIEVQKQAYEAGFLKAIDLSAKAADNRIERAWGEIDRIVSLIKLIPESEEKWVQDMILTHWSQRK